MLRSAGKQQDAVTEPALIRMRGTKVDVYTGAAMIMRLGRVLGLSRGLRVFRLAHGQGVNLALDAGGLRVVKGESRRTFMKASARAMLGVTLAPTLLHSKTLSLAFADGTTMRSTATPLSPADTQVLIGRSLSSSDGSILLQHFVAQGYSVQADKAAAISFINPVSNARDVTLFVPLAGQNLPDVRLKFSQEVSGTMCGAVVLQPSGNSLHVDGYQPVAGTVTRVMSTDADLSRGTPRRVGIVHPDGNGLECGVCGALVFTVANLGCGFFADAACTGACAVLSLGVGAVECALVCYLLTRYACTSGAFAGGVTAGVCKQIGAC